MLDLIQKLISCKPVTADVPSVNKAVAVMKAFLDANGIPNVVEKGTKDGRDILFACSRPGKAHKVLLNAHLDVVPVISEDQWTLKQEGNIVYGRGTSDCECNAVAMAQVLINVRDKADVCAVFTTDEENGGSTTRDMVDYGYVPTELGIIIDGSNIPNIAVAQKGIQVVKLIARGHGGHSSMPWAFDNPIDKLLDGYAKLKAAWKNPTENDQWHDTMAPCMVTSGFANNQIPDVAEMVLNFRFIEPGGGARIIQMVKDITGLEVEPYRDCPPMVSDPQVPAIQKLKNALEAAMPGRKTNFVYMNGATDARHMAHLGVPIAITGFGGGGAHSAKEWLEVDLLNTGIKCMTDFVLDFAG